MLSYYEVYCINYSGDVVTFYDKEEAIREAEKYAKEDGTTYVVARHDVSTVYATDNKGVKQYD